MSVITNTTVISNFASIDQLDLLRHLYGMLYLPIEVYEEIQVGLEEGYQFYAGIDQLIHPFAEEGWLRLTSMADEQELRLFGELPSRLQRGEGSCLAIARHRGWTLLTDDQAARREAERLGIRLSGLHFPLSILRCGGCCERLFPSIGRRRRGRGAWKEEIRPSEESAFFLPGADLGGVRVVPLFPYPPVSLSPPPGHAVPQPPAETPLRRRLGLPGHPVPGAGVPLLSAGPVDREASPQGG